MSSHRFVLASCVLLGGVMAVAPVANAGSAQSGGPFFTNLTPADLNATQFSSGNLATQACVAGAGGGNQQDFQTRCNALAASGLGGLDQEVAGALFEISPEQVAEQGTSSARLSGGFARRIDATIANRLVALRSSGMAAIQLDWEGEVASVNRFQDLRWAGPDESGAILDPSAFRTGAAGPDDADAPRFGFFLSGTSGFGDVDSTFNVRGFQYTTGGITGGVDYRVNDQLIVGTAINWLRTDADFKSNGGDTTADSVGGSLYGTWYPMENLYFDLIFSGSYVGYDLKRKLSYTVMSDTVNTKAHADADGRYLAISGGVGYDFLVDGFTLSPYARAAFSELHVDSYDEGQGSAAGWGMAFASQDVQSATTTLGGEASYPISTEVAVSVPQLRVEWYHEYSNDSQRISSSFLGNTNGATPGQFNIRTDNPDNNYFTLGAEVAATLPNGLGLFAAYDTLLGYDRINSHSWTFGGRVEF
jgi:outer membrane lipase/esterase